MNETTRRDLLRLGLVAGVSAAAFPVTKTLADIFLDEHLDSPPVPSFRVPLRIPAVLSPTRSDATTDYYDITQRVASVPILPGRPPTQMWTYNGTVPGPTIVQRQGRTARVVQRNRLPVPVCVHLHGGDVPASSDGHPADLVQPGGTREYVYPGLHGAANLWYHDHAMHATGRNVYMGLAGMYQVTNDVAEALPLPKGKFDVPLIIQDKFFLPDGQIAYPMHDAERPMRQGVFGDVVLVNGTPKPFFRVARRRYRFRILNGSNARVYRLRLSTALPFTVIGSEGGFLPRPVETQELEISPSERYSVIVDFGRLPIGSKVVLRNVMQDVPGDPYDALKTREVMRFEVTTDATDPTSIPADLPPSRELPNPALSVAERTWELERNGSEWTINDKPWDIDRIDARPRLGTVETWRFVNKSGGWWHPVHVHLVEFAILSRTLRPLAPYELGPKDTVLLRDNEEATVAMRWESFPGRFVMHCHNTEHEDHDMMNQFEVVGSMPA